MSDVVIRTVTTLADDASGATVGSLRYHLIANAASAHPSTIVFDPEAATQIDPPK